MRMASDNSEGSDNTFQHKNYRTKLKKHVREYNQVIKSLSSLSSLTEHKAPPGKSVLDVEVSCWQNYQSVNNPKTVNLLTWLLSDKHATTIENLRRIEDKGERDRLKATLPAITPSGVFTTRRENGLIAHSGLLQFDIDMKDHHHISNYTDLKNEIAKIRNIAYCGLSASGRGFWGLIPIRFPDKHKCHFRALRTQLEQYGIIIDPAPQNVGSLRGYSYDPLGHFNHYATTFKLLDEADSRPVKSFRKTVGHTLHAPNNRSDVEKLLEQIQLQRIDITQGYKTWLHIGFALADEFGETGREYFHVISQFHPEYDTGDTDRQFTNCLRSKGKGITIASFFYIAKEHGLKFHPPG